MISTVIEADEDAAFAAQEAIARALCSGEDHPGYCPVPWTTIICRFADLDPEERGWLGSSVRQGPPPSGRRHLT
jgi:hypothetical protein